MTNEVVKEFKMMRSNPWWWSPCIYGSIAVALIEGSGYATILMAVLATISWWLFSRENKLLTQTYNLLVIKDLCEELEKHGTFQSEDCLNKYEGDEDES